MALEEEQLDRRVWRSLPEVMLEQVLRWLPLSAVLRFKAVCKHWNLFLNSVEFCNSCAHTTAEEAYIVFVPVHVQQLTLCSLYNPFVNKWRHVDLTFLQYVPQGLRVPAHQRNRFGARPPVLVRRKRHKQRRGLRREQRADQRVQSVAVSEGEARASWPGHGRALLVLQDLRYRFTALPRIRDVRVRLQRTGVAVHVPVAADLPLLRVECALRRHLLRSADARPRAHAARLCGERVGGERRNPSGDREVDEACGERRASLPRLRCGQAPGRVRAVLDISVFELKVSIGEYVQVVSFTTPYNGRGYFWDAVGYTNSFILVLQFPHDHIKGMSKTMTRNNSVEFGWSCYRRSVCAQPHTHLTPLQPLPLSHLHRHTLVHSRCHLRHTHLVPPPSHLHLVS